VQDISRLFDAVLGLTEEEASKLVSDVVQGLGQPDLEIPVLLHLIDSTSLDLEHRTHWCPLGTGVIPYDELLKQIFASTTRIEAVIFEFEDKRNPLESLPFLYKCIRAGVSVHHPSLAVRWWG
jgi:hypothetical protein